MLFSNITLLDENLDVREGMYVRVNDGVISYIGTVPPEEEADERVYDGCGKLLMSGFFNAHAHSPMTLLRGYGEDMSLQDWLFTRIFPFEAKLTYESVKRATTLAMAESLANGIVSTSDMYYFCDAMAESVIEAGAKANISRSLTIQDEPDISKTQPVKEMMDLYRGYDGAAGGRIKIEMSLHAEYTNSDDTVRQLADITRDLGCGMHVHVSETKTEVEECKMRHDGMTPPAYLASRGLFDTRTNAAHCVWLEDEDFVILKEKGVSVSANPVSNLKLASGAANYPKMIGSGINVALGTDSVASNNSLDFIQEMKVFALVPKMYYNDPSVMTLKQVIGAATKNGAAAQGRDDTGVLKEGKKADLIVIDLSSPHMHPVHDMCANLVYSASPQDIVMTMVDGEVLYENGEFTTIDIEKAIAEADEATAQILEKLKNDK